MLKAAAVEKTLACNLVSAEVYAVAYAAGKRRSGFGSEQAYRDSTPNTVAEVNRNRAYRVVYMELVIKEPNAEYYYKSRNRAYYYCAERVAHIARSGYSNKTRKRSV